MIPQHAASLRMEILRMDERLVWVNKPSGLLSVPGLGEWNQESVVTRLAREQGGWFKEAHRLDRDTSGVMLAARDADAHREMSRQFREREVEKRYVAVVAGHPKEERGRIDLPMRLDVDRRPWQIVDLKEGKPSVTEYEVLKCGRDAEGREIALVGLTPFTGRTHQLRVHLAAIGHAILGDDLYASEEVLRMSERLLLHAEMLTVTHPTTKERVRVESASGFGVSSS